MSTTSAVREYHTADKTTWGPGEWQDEPDKMQWKDEATGLPCLIVRNNRGGGNLCGYVGVAPGHPAFEQHYDKVYELFPGWDEEGHLEVHGGLTFSDHCAEGDDESVGICHVPDPGEPDHVWWLGFDCAHCFDMSPAYHARHPEFPPMTDEVHRTVSYVRGECRRLAAQLAALAERNVARVCDEGQGPA